MAKLRNTAYKQRQIDQSVYNPTRRNRNIGTVKHGYGQDNKLTIPKPCLVSKDFFERLGRYEKFGKNINGHEFIFVIEHTRHTSQHACSINDIERIIKQIPSADYGELKLIVLRQPKRKEETLAPVWGRLVYSYEFENDYYPAIILEAIDLKRKFKWDIKLSVDAQRELERLRGDGHCIFQDKRHYSADYQIEHVRSTQLYRTLIHEFGHYVQYLESVVQPGTEDEEPDEWERRRDNYFRIPQVEKEKFAHNYADTLQQKLVAAGVIPFDPA